MNLFSTIQVLLELLDLRQYWVGSKVQASLSFPMFPCGTFLKSFFARDLARCLVSPVFSMRSGMLGLPSALYSVPSSSISLMARVIISLSSLVFSSIFLLFDCVFDTQILKDVRSFAKDDNCIFGIQN